MKQDHVPGLVRSKSKLITVASIAVLAMFAALIVFLSLQDVFRKRAIAQVEKLAERFDELRFSMNDDNYADEVETLLADLEKFAKRNGELSGSKAYAYIARIYSNREDWQNCEETWLKAAKAGNKTYMAPIALFNAGAAAEEQGKIETAIEHLQKCVEHPFEFPAAPRAQFNIGRLYEQLGNTTAATEAYRAVLVNWQDVPVWQHLARSAIINIEVK